MVFKKEIPYFKVGAEIRFKLSDITEYLDRNRK